jgi:hypothetical protein
MRRNFVRIASPLLVVALLAAGCGGGDDDDDASETDTTEAPGDDTTDETSGETEEPDGEVEALEVDRSGRFAGLDSYCEPATEEPTEEPEAIDEGITADSLAVTHIRVTLEDLEGLGFAIPIGDPAHQVETFVNIINERCGGIHGRMLDLSLVEAPPVAPSGQDPNAIAQEACIEATEDNQAVFAFSGSGWGGNGGAGCVTGDHETIYITTYNFTDDELAASEGRLFSNSLGSVEGMRYAAIVLNEEGAFDGKTVGVVHSDSAGEPETVQEGLVDTLEELGVNVARVDEIGCSGGSSCSGGAIESVQGMIADGVDVIFPMLNVISMPGYISEMVTQGVQPGDVQFYNTGYNAQSGDLVSSKVITFGGEESGALYNGAVIIAPGATGSFRLPDFEPNPYAEMCNREYQEAGGDTYSPTDPDTNSAYGATTGSCTFVRLIARAAEAAGPNPSREDLKNALENIGAFDQGGEFPGSFTPDKHTAPNQLNRLIFNYPCPEDMIPFDGMCILPDGEAFPFPE